MVTGVGQDLLQVDLASLASGASFFMSYLRPQATINRMKDFLESLEWDLKPGPPDYKSGALTTRPPLPPPLKFPIDTDFDNEMVPGARECKCCVRHLGTILRIHSRLQDLLGYKPVYIHPQAAAVSCCTESSQHFPCRVDFPLSQAEF